MPPVQPIEIEIVVKSHLIRRALERHVLADQLVKGKDPLVGAVFYDARAGRFLKKTAMKRRARRTISSTA